MNSGLLKSQSYVSERCWWSSGLSPNASELLHWPWRAGQVPDYGVDTTGIVIISGPPDQFWGWGGGGFIFTMPNAEATVLVNPGPRDLLCSSPCHMDWCQAATASMVREELDDLPIFYPYLVLVVSTPCFYHEVDDK